MKKRFIFAFSLLFAFAGGAWADNWIDHAATAFTTEGDEAEMNEAKKTLVINSPEKLALLAKMVKEDQTFKDWTITLANDIDLAGHEWTPIGTAVYDIDADDYSEYHPFYGTFDGKDYTISNLKIEGESDYLGLFGYIWGSATIKNVNLVESSITGLLGIGGIAGWNEEGKGGSIENCHVDASVTISGDNYVGGIAGTISYMTIKDCESAATVQGNEGVGGIVGVVYGGTGTVDHGVITDCIYTGESSNVSGQADFGPIVGYSAGSADFNITLDETKNNTTLLSNYDGMTVNVTLKGRTLYKDGNWNTLCLPFSMTDGEATIQTFTNAEMGDNGTLNLNFNEATTSVSAGTPCLIKWESGTDVEDPVFENVVIANGEPSSVASGNVAFNGTFSPVEFTANDKTKLYLAAGNTLYYPNAAFTMNGFRAYFELSGGIVAGDPSASVNQFAIHFNDETTAIDNIQWSMVNGQWSMEKDEWYTIDGIKLQGKPSQKGLYIHNGKKFLLR